MNSAFKKASLVGRRFVYRRIGFDERTMTFREGGLIGKGQAGCEMYWDVVTDNEVEKLRIFGRNRSLTCELEQQTETLWIGRWEICERMMVELRAIDARDLPRAVIIQQADGEFRRMLDLTSARHATYADSHDFTYWKVRGELQIERGSMWNKIRLIFQAFESGFDLVIWLDADTLLVDGSMDLREAAREFDTIGMVKHPEAWGPFPWHFNAGVIFARNAEPTKDFFRRVWARGDCEHPWGDQLRIMEVLEEFPGAVQEINRKWNSHPACNPCDNPIIYAWHGLPERLVSMKKRLEDEGELKGSNLKRKVGNGGAMGEKYFHEAGDGHYDKRFYTRSLAAEERCKRLRYLLEHLVSACNPADVKVILMHGSLIGWHWNQKLLPWDTDIDISVLMEDFSKMERVARSGLAPGSKTLLEVNPHYLDRASSNSSFNEHHEPNRIDARMIDTEFGVFIDITALAWTEDGKRTTKCPHVYEECDILPLQPTVFEGVPVYVPSNVEQVLTQEYGIDVIDDPYYGKHFFNSDRGEWECFLD